MAARLPSQAVVESLLARLNGGHSAVGFDASTQPTVGSQPGGGAPPSPLDVILDIADRPRRAVGNFLTEGAVHGIEHPGDVLGAAGASLGGLVNGLFSQNPADHATTSTNIERITDAYGKTNDPNYQDVQDNVNPILKGITGFVGDVATDPLTYIPGLDIVKAGKIAVDAARGTADALHGADAAKGIVRALAPGTKKMKNKVFGPEPAKAIVDAAAPAATVAAEDASKGVAPAVDSPAIQDLVDPATPHANTPPPPKVSELVLQNERTKPMIDFLDSLHANEKPSVFTTALHEPDLHAAQQELARAQEALGNSRKARVAAEEALAAFKPGQRGITAAREKVKSLRAMEDSHGLLAVKAANHPLIVDGARLALLSDRATQRYERLLDTPTRDYTPKQRAEYNRKLDAAEKDAVKYQDEIDRRAKAAPAAAASESAIGPSYDHGPHKNIWGEPGRTAKADYTAPDGTVHTMTYTETKKGGNLVTGGVTIGEKRVHLSDASPTGPNRRWDSIEERTQGHPAGLTFSNFQTGEKGHVIDDVGVLPELQRKGLASAMHSFAQRELGQPIAHSPNLTGDGAAFAAGAKAIGDAADKAATTTTPLARFLTQIDTEEGRARVEQIIGDQMTTAFARFSNPEKFDAAVKRVRDILTNSGAIDLDSMGYKLPAIGTPDRSVWNALGIDHGDALATRRQWETINEKATVDSTLGKIDSVPRYVEVKTESRQSNMKVAAAEDTEVFAERALRDWLDKDMHVDKETYALETNKGVHRTDKTIGEGLGRKADQIETFKQYSLVGKIRQQVQAMIDKHHATSSIQTKRNIRAMYELRTQEKAYNALDKAGAPIFMSWKDEAGNEVRASLTMPEVYEQLAGSAEGRDLMNFLLFNQGSRVADTTFMQGIARLVADHHIDDVMATITSAAKENHKAGNLPNWLHDGAPKVYEQIGPNERARLEAKYGKGWNSQRLSGQPAWTMAPEAAGRSANIKARPEEVSVMLKGLLDANRDALKQISLENAAKYAGTAIDDGLTLSQAKIGELHRLLEGNAIPDLIVSLRNTGRDIARMSYNAKAPPISSGVAGAVVREAVPVNAIEDSTDAVRLVGASAAGDADAHAAETLNVLQATARRAEGALADDEEAIMRQAPEEIAADDVVIISEPFKLRSQAAYTRLASGVWGFIDPGRVLIDATYAMRGKIDGFRMVRDAGAIHVNMDKKVMAAVNKAAKDFGAQAPGSDGTLLHEGFKAWQSGLTHANPDVAAASERVGQIMSGFLDPEKGVLGSAMLRTTSKFEYLNSVMSRYPGLKKAVFDVERAEAESAKAGIPLSEAIGRQVREWAIDSPAEFMVDFQRASMKVVSDASVAADFMRTVTRLGLASRGPKTGYVRIAATGSSDLAPHLPKDLYLDPEVAYNLHRMDDQMRDAARLGNSSIERFITEIIDPLTQAWKRSATVLHPGHHFRNGVGDWSMTFAAEGMRHSLRASKDVFKVMGAGKSYEGFDYLQALEHLGETTLDNGKPISTGVFGSFSPADLYRAAHDRGLLVDTATIENLAESGTERGAYKNALKAITFQNGGMVDRSVQTITEVRDHAQLMHHFLQAVYKAQEDGYVDMLWKGRIKPKNADELFALVSEKVMRAHPNSLLLSKWERKYATRLIPFYSWMRGALPFVINSSTRYPGRTLALTRGSYNLAVAMGVHPDSLSDPFPADAQFPSFLTDQIEGPQFRGPDGSYFAISPGFSQFDVPNQFLGEQDAVGAVAGMLNPLVRVPIELRTKTDLSTQSQIHDASDYIDSQIPLVNYLANFTGISPSGSVVQTLRGQGLNSQYQVAKGAKSAGLAGILGATNDNVKTNTLDLSNPAGDQALSVLNFLTGAQAQNYSRPSFQKIAQLEQKDRLSGANGTY